LADQKLSENASFQVHSEARGPHWVAWISRGSSGAPERSIVIVGRTQKEAEARARQWGQEMAPDWGV
jgi:hypothetical protein